MKFKADRMRAAVMAGMAVVLLASCGGGSDREAFVPARVIAFGDESSVIETTGGVSTKYTVNSVVFDTAVSPPVPLSPVQFDCTNNPIWVQSVASSYGMAFPECPVTGATANGVMQAAAGATAAALTAQVDSFLTGDAFASNDLVTVMVGENDIIAAYENSATVDPTPVVQQAGTAVGEQVVRITGLGAKVLIATVFDVGLTPYAISRGAGAVATLSELSEAFNRALRLKLQEVRNGGRSAGLVQADEAVLTMARNMSSFGLVNITEPACEGTLPTLPGCELATGLVPTAQASYAADWLWADDRRLGAAAQGRIGAAAVARARGNPF